MKPAYNQIRPEQEFVRAAICAIVAADRAGKRRMDEWTEHMLRVRDHQDRAAFAALFNHFAPRIKAYLMKSGGSPALAEEAAQEAMATVWHKAALFHPEKASASTWIFTIARNKQLDAIRKQRRPEPEDVDWNLSETENPEDAVATTQEETALRDAIAQLPEKQRSIIHKAFYGEMTHAEIAAETGLPLGTIKSRIRLGLERLRHSIEAP